MLNRIAIIGIGLIGASFGLALKRAGAAATIAATTNTATHTVGIDRDTASLNEAKTIGAIDTAGTIADIANADLVMLAIPVRQIEATLSAMLPYLQPRTIIIDTGSTKQDVVAAARATLGARIGQFVPCHPIAGRERHGPSAAEVALFEGKNIVLTPLPENSAATLASVREVWCATGATVTEMSAATHDAVFAAVSHLPHMLAFALVDELASRPNAKLLFEHAASGFRDFTRIASSSPEMWRDIARNNRDALLAEMDRYLQHATTLRELIATSDAAALEAFMQRAQDARGYWLSRQFDQFNDDTV